MQSIDKTINRLTEWKNENVSIQEMTDIFYNQILTQATPSDLKKLENGLQKTWVLGVGGGASVRYFPSSLHPVHLCMDYNLFTHQLQKITLRDIQNRTEYFLIGGKKACEELRQELLYLIHSSPENQSANPLPHSFTPNVKRKGGKFASSPSHSSKSITRFLSIAVILLLIACIWLFLQSTEIGSSIYNRFFVSKPEWIETVQNGFLGEYTDMRVYDLLWNYRLTYEKEEWDGGTTSTGKRIAEVRFSNPGSEATTTIQFEMFDDDVFRVSAFVDPQMPSAKGTDIMYALNAAYYSGICMEYLDDMEKTDAVNQLLQTVSGSEVLYGASVSYTGDRSNLHLLWGQDKLDMSVSDLLTAYGMQLADKQINSANVLETVSASVPETAVPVVEPTEVQSSTPSFEVVNRTVVASDSYSVAILSNGTVKATGLNYYGQCDVSQWSDIISLDSGGIFTVGLRSDGTVVALGDNSYGQCNVGNWNGIVAIAAGSWHTVGLKADGTVVSTGLSSSKQRDLDDWHDIIAVAADGLHTLGLKKDGTVVAVGNNSEDQCNVSSWNQIIAIAAGEDFSLGLRSDGTVVSTGCGMYGQVDVSSWKNIVTISAGYAHALGLKSDGTVVATGATDGGRCNVYGWENITAISAGGFHSIGVKSDGTLVSAGYNTNGECNISSWNVLPLHVSTYGHTSSALPTTDISTPSYRNGSVALSCKELNVRSGPGTNYGVVGRLYGGNSVTIHEEQMQDGMYWGNIGYGWVCMDYIVFGIDNSSPPNVSLDDVFYDIEPLLGVSRADYIGYWVGGSQNTWSLEITKTGNSVYISVERMDNSTDKTVWGMTGTFDNQAILCYSSGVCTSFVNGYSTLRYTTGEGTFVLRDGQMSWYERMEGNITFMTFTRAGAHTTAPSEQGNNQYTQPSQANGNQTTQNIPQRFHSDDLRKALEREVKIQLGYRNGESFEIGYPWLLKYDSSTGKYYAVDNGKWCGSNFFINAVLMDVNGVLTVSTVIECSVK